MPRRKRTRTTSTSRLGNAEPFESRSVRKLKQIRRNVASEAARIMATEGQRNFAIAKRKAAERVGLNPGRLALPSNREVEEALRAYQGLYGGDDHTRNLEDLRATAVSAMRSLEAFNPRLVGPVLDGTADEYSRISLHVFHDPVDETPTSVTVALSSRPGSASTRGCNDVAGHGCLRPDIDH